MKVIMNIDKVREQINKWQGNPASLTSERHGLAILRFLTEQNKISDENNVLLATLYGLLSFSRFRRLKKADKLIDIWQRKAVELGESSHVVFEFQWTYRLFSLGEDALPEPFPIIRETDHGTAKRNHAFEYFRIAENFFKKASFIEAELAELREQTKLANRVEQFEMISRFFDIFTELKKQMLIIVKMTEETKQGSGTIFYSVTQIQKIRTAVQVVEQLKSEWRELTKSESFSSPSPAIEELKQLIGLRQVKERIERLYHFLQYQKQRQEEGYILTDVLSLHMILTGNPGTGKTMLARLLAKIYYELGILERDEVIETNRSQLVGAFVGQTEENTMNMVMKAQGGVLFIDEAYSLKREGMAGNDYGQTAIDTLVATMTSKDDISQFSLILAGYPEEMKQFLFANPGLRSRFPEQNLFHLDDYMLSELLEIGESIALDNGFIFSTGGLRELRARIERAQVDETFGNARTVKNIVLEAIFNKGANVALDGAMSEEDFMLLTEHDVAIKKAKDRKKQTPQESLQALIGLENVKKEVAKLTSFAKIQQLRKKKGLPNIPLELHSVFTGNPGTGKTTVAKIYAEILKEIGLLKRGHLVVCGRSDLVAPYIGQTAIKTKKKIREALGGVLFIDEAYALASKSEGDFGREAVDTLVEEMTKHRDNLVIILAGYPESMNVLLRQNPGLLSRFKKTIHFPNYTSSELYEIMNHYAKEFGYRFEDELKLDLIDVIEASERDGNARFAKKLVDEAIKHQAERLMFSEQLDDEEALTLLLKEDFSELFEKGRKDDETISSRSGSTL